MSVVDLAQWLPAVLALAAWPASVVLVVLAVLVLAPRKRQAAVLASVAELVRAARARPGSSCTDCGAHPAPSEGSPGSAAPDEAIGARRGS